jgi:tetratricopeptide (TPR) repeat protein
MLSDRTRTNDGEGSDNPVFQRERALALVFGASAWPDYPEFHPAPSFLRSAEGIIQYLHAADGLNLPRRNIALFFDDPDASPTLIRHMRDFLRKRREETEARGFPISDLLLYYVGHGGFASDLNTFFLAIRATHEYDPVASSITADSLGRLVQDGASGLRTYVILDCCFAASVTKVFMSAGPLAVASVQLRDKLPPQGDNFFKAGNWPTYGTALLCASGSSEPAMAPRHLSHTMFTGELLEVLRHGAADEPPWLTLDDLQRLVRAHLAAKFPGKATLPEVHAPQQRMGRVDLVPIFRNAKRQQLRTLRPKPTAKAALAASPSPEDAAAVLYAKGNQLCKLGRVEEAITIFESLVTQFGSATEPMVRNRVATALISMGAELGKLGRDEEAIGAYTYLIDHFGSATEPAIREHVVVALGAKGSMLGEGLGRHKEAIAVFDDLLARFGSATEPAMLYYVALALHSKGIQLSELSRHEDAIAVFGDLVRRFASAIELPIRKQVAEALVKIGYELEKIDRHLDAVGVYDYLIAQFGSSTDSAILETVAAALERKGQDLSQLGRSEEAIACFDSVLARFGSATEHSIQEHVARALISKATRLVKLGRHKEANAVCDNLIARFGSTAYPTIHEYVEYAVLLNQSMHKS